jgi:hypothetical protein
VASDDARRAPEQRLASRAAALGDRLVGGDARGLDRTLVGPETRATGNRMTGLAFRGTADRGTGRPSTTATAIPARGPVSAPATYATTSARLISETATAVRGAVVSPGRGLDEQLVRGGALRMMRGVATAGAAAVTPHVQAFVRALTVHGGRLDATTARAALRDAEHLAALSRDDDLLEAAVRATAAYAESHGDDYDPAEDRGPLAGRQAVSTAQRQALVGAVLQLSASRLEPVLAAPPTDPATDDQQLLQAMETLLPDLDYARLITEQLEGGKARAGLVPDVEALSSLVELADAWVRAGKLPWNQTLALVFQTEAELRAAVGLSARPRSQGLRATADVIARSLTNGTLGEAGTAPNVPAAITTIVEQVVGFPNTFIQIASTFERSLLEPPPPAQVSFASQLVLALVQLTFVGATAGVALRVASVLGAKRGLGESTVEGIKTAFENGLQRAAPSPIADGGSDGRRARFVIAGIVMTDPRHAFISALQVQAAEARTGLVARIEALRDSLAQLDLATLNEVAVAIDGVLEKSTAEIGKTLSIEWLNFIARWTTGAAPGQDAPTPAVLGEFPRLRGFFVVEIALPNLGATRTVKMRLEVEKNVRATLLESFNRGGPDNLQNLRVHRVYVIRIHGITHFALILRMGPSGRLVTEDRSQLSGIAQYLSGPDGPRTAEQAEIFLHELVYEINAFTSVRPALT